MTIASLKIGKREFVVIPRTDYDRLRAASRRVSKQDRADVTESLRRLNDPNEKRIPWNQVKKRAGIA